MRFKSFRVQLLAALTGVAAFHFAWREVTYKLADMVAVRADAAGFAALAGDHPWGAVDWCVRILAATNLAWWGILVQLALVAAASTVAYFALGKRFPRLAAFVPWIPAALYALPAMFLGEELWMLVYPHFPQMHIVWFAILAACLFAGRYGLGGFAALQILLVVCGLICHDDLSPAETLHSAWTMPLRFDSSLKSKFTWSCRDPRDQLAMERAVREQRFSEVLKIAPDKKAPYRMESAWRILAMYRTGRLERDFNRFPMSESHMNTREKEMVMEGPLLLFHYGLLLPARRWIFELAAFKGWQPQSFRLLGDISVVSGDRALARKYYAEYARFPFRGGFAAKRLAALDGKRDAVGAFPDLKPVAELDRRWRKFGGRPEAPAYQSNDTIAERVAYELLEMR